MFQPPARPSMAPPRFTAGILIKLSAQRLAILGSFLVALCFAMAPAHAHAQAINCPSGFTTVGSGACSISVNGGADDFWIANHPSTILSGTAAILAPSGAGHQGNSLIRQTPGKCPSVHCQLDLCDE